MENFFFHVATQPAQPIDEDAYAYLVYNQIIPNGQFTQNEFNCMALSEEQFLNIQEIRKRYNSMNDFYANGLELGANTIVSMTIVPGPKYKKGERADLGA